MYINATKDSDHRTHLCPHLLWPVVEAGQGGLVLGHIHLALDVLLEVLGLGHVVGDIDVVGVLSDAMCDGQRDWADLAQWGEHTTKGQVLILHLLCQTLHNSNSKKTSVGRIGQS